MKPPNFAASPVRKTKEGCPIAILAIDTCLSACSVAVANGDLCHAVQVDIGVGHAERLAPMVLEVLAAAALSPPDVRRLAVTVGPGSFMGVRVGISFAKGFGFAHAPDFVPMTSLAALWLSADAADGYAVLDARRGEVYVQGFGAYALAPSVLPLASAATLPGMTGPAPLIGGGAGLLGRQPDWPDLVPDIRRIAAAAQDAPTGPLVPLYLRAPDAKPAAKRLA